MSVFCTAGGCALDRWDGPGERTNGIGQRGRTLWTELKGGASAPPNPPGETARAVLFSPVGAGGDRVLDTAVPFRRNALTHLDLRVSIRRISDCKYVLF